MHVIVSCTLQSVKRVHYNPFSLYEVEHWVLHCIVQCRELRVWPKTRPGPARPEKTRPTRPKKRPGPAGAVHVSLLTRPKTRPSPARVGPMDGGAFEVSMAMDGQRQLRNDWPDVIASPRVQLSSTGSLRLVI